MKKDALAFAAALAVMSLAGCTENNDTSVSEPKELQTEPDTAVTEVFSVPETKVFEISPEIDFPDVDYINEIEYKDGKIVMSGVRNSYSGFRKRFILKDLDSGEEKELAFDEFSSIEYAAVVPEGIALVYINGGGDPCIAVVDIKTGKVRKNITSADGKNYYISKITVTESGDIILIKYDYQSMYSSYYPAKVSVKADIYSSDLELKNTLDLNSVCGMSENDRLGDFCVSGNSLFCSAEVISENEVKYNICEISLEDLNLKNSYDFPSQINGSLLLEDTSGDLCVISDIYNEDDDYEYYRLNRAENKFTQFKAEIHDVHMIRAGNSEYDLIFIGDEDGKIYGYSFETGERTLLCGFSAKDSYYMDMSLDSDMSLYGNVLIMMDSSYFTDDKLVICSMEPDGSDRKYTLFSGGDTYGFSRMCTGSNNDIYGFKAIESADSFMFSDEDTEANDSNDVQESENSMYLISHYSAETRELAEETDISEIIGSGEFVTADWISADKNGNINLVYHTDGTLGLGMTFILITDMNGNKILHAPVTESCSSAYYDSEKGMLVTAGFGGIEVFSTDISNGSVTRIEKSYSDIRGERVVRIYPGDDKYDFYCSDIRELYGFRSEDNSCEKVFSRDYEYDHNYDITSFCPVNDGKFFCQAYNAGNTDCFLLVSPK